MIKLEKEYLPLRNATQLTITNDPVMQMVYRCSLRHEVTVYDDGTEESRKIMRAVWSIHLSDMPRSKMPVTIFHKGRMYRMAVEDRQFVMYSPNLDMTVHFLRVMPRPFTPHHLFHMIDYDCSYQRAVSDIRMTEDSIKKWREEVSYAPKPPKTQRRLRAIPSKG